MFSGCPSTQWGPPPLSAPSSGDPPLLLAVQSQQGAYCTWGRLRLTQPGCIRCLIKYHRNVQPSMKIQGKLPFSMGLCPPVARPQQFLPLRRFCTSAFVVNDHTISLFVQLPFCKYLHVEVSPFWLARNAISCPLIISGKTLGSAI